MRLEPFEPAHLPLLLEIFTDPEVTRFTRIPSPLPEGFADRWLERYAQGSRDGSRAGFAIVSDEGEVLGIAVAASIDVPGRTAELGYLLAPAARGRGLATQALQELTEWAFAERGILRCELLIAVDNVASRRVAERAGYAREGVMRSKHLKDGIREDTELWSRLPSDRA